MNFIAGRRSPVEMSEGLRISTSPPMLITIGIARPNPEELLAFNFGRIIHRFGHDHFTSWMTLHFYIANDLMYKGEVFHAAGKSPEEFTDQKLRDLRANLSPDRGIACVLVIIDSETQIVATIRMYAWSNELSMAFLNAAEHTRRISPRNSDRRAKDLMQQFSTDDLSRMARDRKSVV